ncbi:Beta-hexosaminidase [Fusarium oxysporum f. sp. vasinfectum]|nr:Beta-hexosaminidase [Fusarium oxysporum f. sp. vasinfectum]
MVWKLCFLFTITYAIRTPREAEWSDKSYGPDGPWNAVKVQLGSKDQSIALFPGATWETWVISDDYCEGETCFASKAGTYNKNTGYRNEKNRSVQLDGFMQGVELKGDAGVRYRDDIIIDGINIANASVAVLDHANIKYPGGKAVPLSLGCLSVGAPNAINQSFEQPDKKSSFNASLLPGFLWDRDLTSANSFGMHIGSPDPWIPGSLVFGGYDKARIIGNVLITPGSPRDNGIELHDIAIESFGKKPPKAKEGLLAKGNSTLSKGLNVTIDGCSPYLTLPKSTCDSIAEHLPVTFNKDLGLYLWDTESEDYERIVNSATALSFSFPNMGDITKIRVPLMHLNLTLSEPIVDSPVPYFPCYVNDNGRYVLGRAFLQDAFLGANWGPDVNRWWLAQAPGPRLQGARDVQSSGSSDMSVESSDGQFETNAWEMSWTSAWNDEAAPLSTPSKKTPQPEKEEDGKKPGVMLKEYLVAGILLASPLLAVAQDLIPPILEKADSFVEETWSVDSSPKFIYIDDEFASVSDKDGLTLIPPTAHEFATSFQDDLAKITGSKWTLKRVDKLSNNASGISLGSYTGESSDLRYENGKSTSEGYEIIINSNRVFIGGSGARGMWWGNQDLSSTSPSWQRDDHEGYMLDAGRKWYSKDFLKELCSYASFFKMNEFHYHLSDNYPLNRGKNDSWRDVYSHFSLLPEDKSLRGILHGRENETLSRDDFMELQSHCASRGVTVIPEIEAPGHSLYLTKWKPELALAKKDLLNLTHPETLPTVQSIWEEFLPWFKTKEVHIGADEYDAELADDYITFVNKMSRFINSTTNKRSRIWGTHEPSKRNQTIDKNVIIQHWQYGQSDPVQLVKDGYDVINSEDWWAYTSLKNDHMPILPARYPQFFNESRVFNFADKEEWQWTPADFNPVNTSLQLKSDEKRLRGATLAAWNDNGPDATTQLEAYYSMRRGIAVVGGRAWSGSRGPKLLEETSDTSVDFYSPRAPDQNLDRVLSLGANGTLVSWTRSGGDGKEVHLGHGSKGMNYTLTLSVTGPFTLSGLDNTLSLDKSGNMVFTADGWEFPLRKVTKDDALDLDPGAPGRIWVNTSSTHKPVKVSTPVNITLVTDVLHGTVVFSDGEVVGRFEVFVYGGRNTQFSWSQMAFVAPLDKIEGGLERLELSGSSNFTGAGETGGEEPTDVPQGSDAARCVASSAFITLGGVNVNSWDEGGLTALHAAIHCSGPTACLHIIDVLLRHSADINALSKAVQHILHTVAQSGGTVEYLTRLAAKLLQHGADANVVGSSGNPALYTGILNIACFPQAWERGLMDALLQGGAGANALDGNGASALHLAATHDVAMGVVCCTILPSSRGPLMLPNSFATWDLTPNARDEHGQTPLLHATVAGLVKMVRLLCESGIGVNTPIFDDNNAAFFCAVRLKTVDAVQVLLHYGADLRHRGHSGRTVLHYHEAAYKARSNGSTDVARINKLLIACGAKVNAKRGCCRQGHGMNVLDAGGITRAQGEFALFLMANGALSFRYNRESMLSLVSWVLR